jgi:hypothetical protein
MTYPDPNPETGGRPLAEILREAGIDMSKAARRRRWNDPGWDDPVPQRRTEPDDDDYDTGSHANFRRRRSDQLDDTGAGRPIPRARPADPSTAAIPGLRPSQKPDVPTHPSGPVGTRGERHRDAERHRDSDRLRQRERPREPERVREPEPLREPERAREPQRAREPERLRQVERVREPEPVPPARGSRRPDPLDDHPSTGPIPIATDLEDDEVGGRESALAWLRFAGELVIALAVGVGVYFAFTVLWEMLPYAAVVAAPLVVAGLVAGVSMWRTRLGRDPVSARLLVVLVFAGTLLTIAPAAGLLSGA